MAIPLSEDLEIRAVALRSHHFMTLDWHCQNVNEINRSSVIEFIFIGAPLKNFLRDGSLIFET
jgi:hypothetical protein